MNTAADAMLMPGDRGEHGVRSNCRDAEAATDAAQHLVCHFKRVAADVGDRDQQPHQHEQRDNAENVVGDRVVHREGQQIGGDAEIAADQPHPNKGQHRQRERDIHARIDQHEHESDRNETDDVRLGHDG